MDTVLSPRRAKRVKICVNQCSASFLAQLKTAHQKKNENWSKREQSQACLYYAECRQFLERSE